MLQIINNKNEELVKALFRTKPMLMLMNIYGHETKQNYASAIAKEIDCTYSHVVKLLQKFEENGVVKFEKTGRLKLITLTKKGEEVCSGVEVVVQKLN